MRCDERGSSVPFILLCFLIAMLLTAGVTAASMAFLAQRDLQADCDGAAIAASSAYDPAEQNSLTEREALPLAQEKAQRAVEKFARDAYPNDSSAQMSAQVGLTEVTVDCRRTVHVPFGTVFGYSDGLVRTASSSARSPFLRS
jgi:hypothetical protein